MRNDSNPLKMIFIVFVLGLLATLYEIVTMFIKMGNYGMQNVVFNWNFVQKVVVLIMSVVFVCFYIRNNFMAWYTAALTGLLCLLLFVLMCISGELKLSGTQALILFPVLGIIYGSYLYKNYLPYKNYIERTKM
ncbi:MAG: hypothetical protein NTW93_00185 [Phycisphaerae bacterium]|jgi:hypothetical protein|nr:hypothetical protein [Phycisphaerae bacterium]